MTGGLSLGEFVSFEIALLFNLIHGKSRRVGRSACRLIGRFVVLVIRRQSVLFSSGSGKKRKS